MAEKQQVKFKYIFDDNYNPKYVNGAYGGITPNNEIAVNFFFERQGLPVSQTYEVSPEGIIEDEVEKKPTDLQASMIRFIDTGIILNIDSAKKIAAWLNEKIELLERAQSNIIKPN